MGLFDRIVGKKLTPPSSTPNVPAWLTKADVLHDQLRAASDPRKAGTAPDRAREILIPILALPAEGLERWYGIVISSFVLATFGRSGAVGLAWCDRCANASPVISAPTPGETSKCPSCGRKYPLQYLEYSPSLGAYLRDLFARHWECRNLMDAADACIDTDPKQAVPLYQQAEALCRAVDNPRVLAEILCAKAEALHESQGDLDEVARALTSSEALYTRLENWEGLLRVLRNRADQFALSGDHGMAHVLFHQAEDAARLNTSPRRSWLLVTVLRSRADFALRRYDTIRGALPIAQEADRLLNEWFPTLPETIRATFGHAFAKTSTSKVQAALDRLGDGPEALVQRAHDAAANAQIADAIGALSEARALLRHIGDDESLLRLCNSQLNLLVSLRAFGDALECCRECEQLARKLNDRPQLASALLNQAAILGAATGDGAEPLRAEGEAKRVEGERIQAELNDLATTEAQLAASAQALTSTDGDEALKISAQLAECYRTQGKRVEWANQLLQHGALLAARGEHEAALGVFERVEAIGYLEMRLASAIAGGLARQSDQLAALGRPRLAEYRLGRAMQAHLKLAEAMASLGQQGESFLPPTIDDLCHMMAAYGRYAEEHTGRGDMPETQACYRTLISLADRALPLMPSHARLRMIRAHSLDGLGISLVKGTATERQEGIALIREAATAIDQLDRDLPGEDDLRSALRAQITQHKAQLATS